MLKYVQNMVKNSISKRNVVGKGHKIDFKKKLSHGNLMENEEYIGYRHYQSK